MKVIDAAVDGSQVEAVEETLTLLKQNEMVLVCHKGLNAWLICAPTRIACEEMEVAKKRPNGARNFCFVIGDIEKFYTLCDKDSLPSALDSSEKLAMFEQAHLRVALTNNSSANDILVRDGMVQGALFPEAESGLRSYFKELEVGLEGCSDQELLLGKDYHTALATSANYHGQGNIVDFEEAKEFAEGLGVKLCVCFEPTLHIDPGHLTIFEIKHQSITSVRKGTMYSHLIEKDTMKAIRVSFAKRVIDSLDLMSANLDLNDIYDIFNSIDTNGDKGLCEEEFYNFVLKVNASSKESTSEEDASVLFKAIDINGDKEISFIELFQFLEYAYDGHSPQMSKLAAKFVSAIRSEGDDIQDVEAIMRLFEKIDTDNSNDVDKKELRDFLLSHEFSSVEIDVLFALIDKTLVEDDSIHFMELYEFLQSIQADESLQDDDEEVEVTVEKADDNKLEQVLEDDVKSNVSKESLEVVEESEEVLGLGLKVIDAAVDGSQVEAVEETLTLLKQNEMVLVCHKGLNAWLICAPTRIACEEMEVAKKRPNGARNFCFVIGDIERFYTLCDKDSLPSALDSSEKLAMFEQAHLRVALTNNSSANDILVRDGMVQGALFPEAESGLRSYFKELEVGLEGCSDQELLLGKDYHTALATSANYHGQGNIVDFEEAKEFAEGLGVKLCVCFEPTLHIDPGHLTIFEIKHQSITSVRKGTMYSHLIEKDTMKAIRVSFAKRVIDSLDLMSANLDLNDIYDIFNSIDTNGDKGLCEEEFYNFVLKVNASSKESTSEEDASVLFKAIDINGDKEISFIELFQFLEYAYDGHSPQMSKLAAKFVSAIRSEGDDIQDVEAIMRLFEKIDTDNSNDVDKKELRDFLLSHEFSSVEIDVLFALIDKTLVEDDSIHFMELYEFLQSIQADESLQDDDEEVEVTVEKADDNKLEQVLEDDVKSDVSKESLEVVEESEEVLGLGLKVIDAAVDGSQVEAVEETLTLLKQNEMVLVCHKGLNAWLICAPTRIACEEMEVAKKRPNGARNFCFVIGDIEKFYTLCDKDSLPSALDSSEKLAMFEQAHLRVALTNNSSANDILVRDGMVQGALFPEAESGLRSYFKELEVGLEGCSDQELLLGKDYHTALATSANYHGQGNIVDFEEAKEFAEGLGVKLCVCFEPTLHIDPGHLTIFEIKHQSITSVRKGTMYSHLIEKDTMKAIRVSFAKRVIDSLDLMSANLDLNDIYDIFNSIDTNGDKGLCEEEFYNFVLKVNASSKESTSEEDASVLFKAIDINGDKEISFIELFQFLEYAYDGHSPQMSKLAAKFVSAIRSEGDDIQDVEAIMRLFEKIDTDNSNDVDKKELRDFLLSHEFSSVEIDVLFALIDKTLVEDDSIHFMELYEFLQSIQADESLQDDDEEVEVTVEKADDNKLEQVLEDDVKSDVSKESLEVVEESEEVLGLGLKVIDAAVDGSQVEAVEETLTLLKQNEMVLVCHKGLNAWLICAPTRIACEEMEVAKKRPNGARNFCFVIGDIEKFYTLCDKDSLPSALDSSEKLAMFEQAHLRVALTNNSSANDILVRDGMVQGALFPEAESGLRSYFKELEVGLEGCSDQELLLGKDYHTALATSANYHGQGNIVDFEEAKEFAEGLGVKLCVCFEPTLHIDPGHLTIFEIKHQSITSVRKGTMYSHLIEKDTMKAIRVSFAKRVIDSLDLMSANLDLNDIYDIFNSIDTNGDKGLCEEEFYNFVLKVNASNKESTSEEDASVLFKAIDINGDKEISFIELFQFLEYAYDGHSPQMSKLAAKFVSAIRSEGDDIQDVEAIMRLFEKIDTDNSNDVDKKELRDFLLSHEFSSVEIDVLFALIDKTLVEDDSIHFMELYEFLQSIQADESLQDESEEVEVTVEKAEDNKLEQLLEDDVKSDVSKESLEVVEASEEVEETDEVIVDEVSEVEHLVEDNVKSDASNSSLEVAEESEEVKESEQAMAADDNELEQENDVKSDEPKESLEEGEESEEVKEEESEEVDETANDEGTDIVIDEDEPKQTEVETVSNKKVSTKFEDQPTKIRISTAKTRASVASNSMHTKSTAASSSRPRSRGRSPGAVHLRLYDVSASYQEEGRMKRLEVENRLRKIAEEKNGYYPGGKNRQMHNARRDSFRNEFQKPQGKITVAQAVSLYDRLVSLKQKTEEKKLLLRKERQERELMYIPR
ncbi:predicted protein [Chaetoceros tenuissimus]|uniref:EF-hand domain-containing protein n=1 Tax=Chaetoceros tenuissimus TaxID=426638 RepID=A0AAD3H2G5_9STRA|nr:predicted protein [Chaetoceros tenuissimus]